MSRVQLIVAYVGTPFSGWQIQPGKKTVQAELETALATLYAQPVAVTGSGRTDAGVHALAQSVHFDAPAARSCERIVAACNRFLPPEIRVLSAKEVSADFNARKSALDKTYEYRFYVAPFDDPFLLGRATRLWGDYDTVAMQKAASVFVGTHDFAAFRLLGSNAKTTVRTVYSCSLNLPTLAPNDMRTAIDTPIYTLTICANGFLYKMVRLIMGALLQVGKHALDSNTLQKMLDSGEELWLKKPAPAEGLYLKSVTY